MKAAQQDIELRKLKPEDAAWLSALAIKAYSEHYADTWYDNGAWYMNSYLSTARLQDELQQPDSRFYGICYKKQAVGFLKINIQKPLGAEPEALELERIYLTKQASGKGIGTCVMNFVFEQARAEQKKLVWLKVMDTNPDAVRFYSNLGFEICGTHQVDFLQKKEGMRGMYVMQKNIGPPTL